jgi:hypothetical protein
MRGVSTGRFRANQPGAHTLAVRGLDSHPTPRIAVECLLNAEPDVLNTMTRVWEPAAGDGNIVHVLRDNGIPVIASDIEKGNCDLHFVGDFLQQTQAPTGAAVLVTNPPYKLAAQFAEHALSLVPDVYLNETRQRPQSGVSTGVPESASTELRVERPRPCRSRGRSGSFRFNHNPMDFRDEYNS